MSDLAATLGDQYSKTVRARIKVRPTWDFEPYAI